MCVVRRVVCFVLSGARCVLWVLRCMLLCCVFYSVVCVACCRVCAVRRVLGVV